MASPSPADEERRARIITHMNRNHTRELSHLLRHYAPLPPSSTSPHSSCTLVDVHLQRGMLIRAPSGSEHLIPFDPASNPLTSWADVKDRIVAMDGTARAALGISDILITEPPTFDAFNIALISGIVLFAGSVVTLPYVRPGSGAWAAIDGVIPGGAGIYRLLVGWLAWPVLAIHVVEALAFERRRMQRHGVRRWSALWWKWEINVLVQGFGAWRNIDAILEEEKRKRDASKSR